MNVKVIIRSGASYDIKDYLVSLVDSGVISPKNVTRLYFKFNTKTLEGSVFEIYDTKNKVSYSLDTMAMGYSGNGPTDLLECVRALGFDEKILPSKWILTKCRLIDEETILFEVEK